MRSVRADGSTQFGANQGHAGDIHGALTVPLDDAARRFLTDGAGLSDVEDFVVHQRIECGGWTDGDGLRLGDGESDFAGTLASQRRGRRELAPNHRDEACRPLVSVVVKEVTA